MESEHLATLAVHTIGGGWGKEQFDERHTVRVAVIRGTDIPKLSVGDISTVPKRWETPRKVESRLLRYGDIVIEVSGGSPTSGQHTGRALLITKEMIDQLGGSVIPASFCRLLRLNNSKVDPRYVTYQIAGLHFSGEIGQFENQSTGLANFQFQKFIDSVCPDIADISEQRRVSEVLNCLDDRIRHNRALAANLEAIVRRLFKSWFVDFDPVRAKAAGENPPGLADDIAVLFPEQFVDSELGEIPGGWRLETLTSVARLNPETWTTRKHPDEIRYLDLSNVKDGLIDAPTKYSWEEAPSRARRVLQQGDTIIGTVRPGNRSFALIDQAGLTGSTGFAVLRPLCDVNREFLYIAATSDDAIERLAHLADGAAYPAVRPEVVLATEIVMPSEEIMTAFSALTEGMIDLASVCKQEIKALAGIRDLLLPRLISGKLRVEDAESVIEEAIT